MAAVTHIQTTGDNDPELYPVEYYQHYFYCDKCGSFDLEYWFEPGIQEELDARKSLAKRINFELGVLVGSKKRSKFKGVVCNHCGARYGVGSDFLSRLDDNPRNLTIDDVPRPLNGVLQVRGGRV